MSPKKRDWLIDESQMDHIQIKIVNAKADIPLIVRGCAGSGKSVIALWKARDIQRKNSGSYLFVTFTKTLTGYLSDGIKAIGLDGEHVCSLNKCFSWKKVGPRKFQMLGWKLPDYDFIIVDEAQDISEEALIEMQKHAKVLLLYGDSGQQIYKNRHALTMEEIKRATNYEMMELLFNYRLPVPIASFVDSVMNAGAKLKSHCMNKDGQKPYVLNAGSIEAQVDKLISVIKTKGLSDVGIFVAKSDMISEVHNLLEAREFQHVVIVGDSEGFFANENQQPVLMTFHRSKGLQFESVFIVGYSDEYLLDDFWVNPLYVAITRSYNSLYILHDDSAHELLSRVTEEQYLEDLSDNEFDFEI